VAISFLNDCGYKTVKIDAISLPSAILNSHPKLHAWMTELKNRCLFRV